METLKSAHRVHKVKFVVFINIVFFIILSYICPHKNNENTISVSLENGSKLDISFDIRSHRTLAKYEEHNDLMYAKFQYKPDDNRNNNKLGYRRENHNTYERLKRGKQNNIESYLNSFKYRHSKKSGLKKLDCYCEKKLFSRMDKIEKLAKQKNFSKRRIKRIIYKTYGLPLFLLSLIPLFAFAIPVYVGKVHIKGIDKCKVIYDCSKKQITEIKHGRCTFTKVVNSNLVYIFLIISIIIILLLIIYAYMKISKYMRIKEGMSK